MPKPLPDTATCLGCKYSLRGLPTDICPECGRTFNPEDPTTYRAGPVVSTWRWWARPPGIWHNATILVITLLMLNVWSGGAGFFLGLLSCGVTFTVGPLLVVVYLVRAAAAYADRRRADYDRGQYLRPKNWRWLVTPICLALVISAGLTHWPMRLRFGASQQALEAEAKHLLAQAGPSSPGLLQYNRYVGLYYVYHVWVQRDPPSVHFITDPSPFEGWGFLYCRGEPHGSDSQLPDGWRYCED